MTSRPRLITLRIVLVAGTILLFSGHVLFSQAQSQTQTDPATTKPPDEKPKKTAAAQTYVLVGAGDIASCKNLSGAEATAKLIEGIPGEVFAAGDLAYEKGTAEEFKNCYDKTW